MTWLVDGQLSDIFFFCLKQFLHPISVVAAISVNKYVNIYMNIQYLYARDKIYGIEIFMWSICSPQYTLYSDSVEQSCLSSLLECNQKSHWILSDYGLTFCILICILKQQLVNRTGRIGYALSAMKIQSRSKVLRIWT